ncbi:MAG: flagellar biosynthesis anti-sigma factor FlgM [Planctomycetales bacterium]|nr:flagellar biosynthesis anti-sigma factor FlgM [Planctomycetales bacterium]
MHIRGLSRDGNHANDAGRVRHESNNAAAAGNGASSPNGEVKNSEATLARSPEIARLAEKVRRSPEVRPEQVARAQQRLASGYYLTQEAAEQTADKLMS